MTAEALLAAFRTCFEGIESRDVADFLAGVDWRMTERPLEPASLPCLRHLSRVAEIAPDWAAPLARLLVAGAEGLHWARTYSASDFGAHFVENYGWLELFGTRGHFVNEDMAAGFLILGPNLIYPDHHHVAEEIYLPLTGGTAWRKGEGDFSLRPAGEVVHHPSDVNHAMRTGEEPLLALYLWRGGPLAQRPVIASPGAVG